MTLSLKHSNDSQSYWWRVQEDGGNPNNMTVITFNERIAPGAFSFFTSYG